MLKVLLLGLVVLGSLWISGSPVGSVMAQSNEDFLADAECADNPNSEQCICARVRQFSLYPQFIDTGGGVIGLYDSDDDGEVPFLDPDDGLWKDGVGEAAGVSRSGLDPVVTELVSLPSNEYGQNCSLAYFRENLRRLWFFAVALGGGLAALSLGWAGVAYMQASASGADLSRSRTMIMRVLIGIVILACAYLIWEGASNLFLGGYESWSLDKDAFYDLN